jgi:putative ABC transport system permease protein
MTLGRDLRSAIRGLLRDRAYTTLALLSLGFGIAESTLIFSLVDGVLLRPLRYREPDRLVAANEVVVELAKTYPRLPVSARHYFEWKDRVRSFSQVGIVDGRRAVITGTGDPEQVEAARVSSTLLPMLGARVRLGRLFQDDEDQPGRNPVVLLADSLWERRYAGDPTIVGRTITVDGTPRTVVGVLEPGFHLPSSGGGQIVAMPDRAQIYTPIAFNRDGQEWGGPFNYCVIARLRSGRTLGQASSELNILEAEISTHIPEKMHVAAVLTPLQDEVTGSSRTPLFILLAAVGAVLLIVCVNLANLALARGAARARDVAIRRALGATPWRLLRAALVESLCLGLAGGALGTLCAWAGLRVLVSQAPIDLPRIDEVAIDARILGFAFGLSWLTGLLFGALPAWRATRVPPQATMGGQSRTFTDGRGGRLTRNLLVGAETALGAALLVVAGLLIASFVRLLGVDAGIRPGHVLTTQLTLPRKAYPTKEVREAFYHQALDRVAGVPGVTSVALVSKLPLQGESWVDLIRRPGDNRPAAELPPINFRFCSPEYFRAMGIPIVAGRGFTDADRPRKLAVISASAARLIWPHEDPVGQAFGRGSASGEPPTIVAGVVRDVSVGLETPAVPTLYIPYWDTGEIPDYYMAVRHSGAGTLAPAIRRAIWSLDRDVVVGDVRTMDQVLSASVAVRRFELALTSIFAGSAMLLACLGIYGVVSWSVARRRNEIGIRMALGAGRGRVRRMIVGEGMRPVLVGLSAGLLSAWLLGRVISSLLFGISPHDGWTMAAVAGVLTAVSAAACYLPARRATRADPLDALRYE